MAKTQADYITRTKVILQDDAGVLDSDDTELKALLSDAVNLIYEKDRPRLKVHELTGDGANYDFDLPADFIAGYSMILKVEYPAGSQSPVYMAQEDYAVYDNGTAKKFRFLVDTPGSGEKALLIYTCPHNLNESENTVYEGDFDAVCHLTAGIALLVMGNKYSQTKESTIGADVVEYRAKSDICRALAKEQFNLYDKAIGKKDEATAAALIREYDTSYPWGGELLTHPSRWR